MQRAGRIIDANANRAREGLRVMEDIARFVLDDRALSAQIKSVRHRLVEAVAGLGVSRDELLAARDTPGDVGTTISTERETTRAGLRDVAITAAARVGEALRMLEELAKISGAGGGGPFELLRYEVYEIERLLVPRLGNCGASQWHLCVLVTESLCRHGSWDEVAERAFAGGAACVQLREKSLGDREFLARARRLVGIAREHGARAIINDRPDIAVLADADGVHVGQDDLSPAQARRVVGPERLVGASTSCVQEAYEAVRGGADYCGIGPIFATATKPDRPVRGIAYLQAYLADDLLAGVPHLAIGGITLATIGQIVASGGRGVAVSSCVCGSPEPGEVCRQLVAAFDTPARQDRACSDPSPAGPIVGA